MKHIEAPTKKELEQLEEELERQRELDFERELFEKYDLPIFLEELADYAETEPGEIMKVLHYLFFYGYISGSKTKYKLFQFRGSYPLETAMVIYADMESGAVNKERLAVDFRLMSNSAANLMSGTPDTEDE